MNDSLKKMYEKILECSIISSDSNSNSLPKKKKKKQRTKKIQINGFNKFVKFTLPCTKRLLKRDNILAFSFLQVGLLTEEV